MKLLNMKMCNKVPNCLFVVNLFFVSEKYYSNIEVLVIIVYTYTQIRIRFK
jgi:hypothetical protein